MKHESRRCQVHRWEIDILPALKGEDSYGAPKSNFRPSRASLRWVPAAPRPQAPFTSQAISAV
ncbi:MAG: hypothetical protein J2P21_24700, partial [Chloracidobacterium sp.]|nr:hypothetical protein [Chloracidobacterium sp.]